MTTLRPYQRAAIDALIDYWRDGGGNPLVEMATGTGKSVVIATLVRELIEQFDPNMRIVMLVHVRELVAQNAAALLRTWPGAPVGINSASLGRRDRHAQILFASIQSVYRSAVDLGPRSLVLIDEAHLVPRDGEGMYRRFLTDLREREPDMRVAGFTATPYRLDSGRLDEGEDDERLFDRVVYRYGIGEGIRDQFLSPLTSKATTTAIDVSGVARRGGEFIAGALEDAVDKDWITKAAVEEIVAFGANRRSWLAFCAGVRHAEHVRDAIRAHGITCETVTGDTPIPERDRIIAAFKSGAIRCLTNANVLTTGFDAPAVDLIAMLRPTLSTGLYVQIVGRGTRLASGKTDCLVLDFAGNVRRHGPVDQIEVGGAGGEGKAAVDRVMAKECPACHELLPIAVRVCTACDHEFPAPEKSKHEARADATAAILSTSAPAWIEVYDWSARRHEKEGGRPSMRVEYRCGMVWHKEWICFEHSGPARSKAEAWWRRMGAQAPIPSTIDEALARFRECRKPEAIAVRPEGRFYAIVAHRHEQLRGAA